MAFAGINRRERNDNIITVYERTALRQRIRRLVNAGTRDDVDGVRPRFGHVRLPGKYLPGRNYNTYFIRRINRTVEPRGSPVHNTRISLLTRSVAVCTV